MEMGSPPQESSGGCICFAHGESVQLNMRGRDANIPEGSVRIRTVVGIIRDESNAAHPERYELDPPHPYGPISGMFLEAGK
jgi:hypothetical protein